MTTRKILHFHLPKRFRPDLATPDDTDQLPPKSNLKHRCFIIDFQQYLAKPIIVGSKPNLKITS